MKGSTHVDSTGRQFDGWNFDDLSPRTLRARHTMKWSRYGPDVTPAWVAEMDFPTAPPVLEAIADAVRREEFGYPVMDQDSGLPDALASWAKTRYGWSIEPSRVHILPDVLRGVELSIEAYSPQASPVILPTPAYMPFFAVPGVVGREIIQVPMLHEDGRYRLDLQGIDRAFAAGGRTLILCQPYNPVGRLFTHDELQALSDVVTVHGGRVVSDEIHAPLTLAGAVHVPYASVNDATAAHTLTLTSASKAWNLPGLKCACAIVSNDADEQVWQSISMMKTHGASTIGIEANVAAFRDGGDWLDAMLGYLEENRRLMRQLLAERLPAVRYVPPEATYFAWLDCRDLRLGIEPSEFFLEHALVAVNPGPPFGANADGFVRFNLATSRHILEQAVSRMGAAVRAR